MWLSVITAPSELSESCWRKLWNVCDFTRLHAEMDSRFQMKNDKLVPEYPLVIFGAGGLAHELWGWIKGANDCEPRKRVTAFVVDGVPTSEHYDDIPIMSREQAGQLGVVEYLIAIADPLSRKRLSAELDALGWIAGRYIHESAMLGVKLSIGKGTMIFPRCSISSDATLGEHVLVNGGTAIGHDCVIGSYSSLLGGASINGGVTLGEGVLVGAGAIIHPGKKVGDGAIVGMGSAVFRHVAAEQTVFGNPARPLC
jgi:acetyltransferase EpsM